MTATTDRTCALTICQENEYELLPPIATADRKCEDLDYCDSSTMFESVSPTPTSNRNCTQLSGKCLPGTYEDRSATPTSDRHCTVCLMGTTDHDENPLVGSQPSFTQGRMLCQKVFHCNAHSVPKSFLSFLRCLNMAPDTM